MDLAECRLTRRLLAKLFWLRIKCRIPAIKPLSLLSQNIFMAYMQWWRNLTSGVSAIAARQLFIYTQ